MCKDMDFPALSRQYANQGTALLLVPAFAVLLTEIPAVHHTTLYSQWGDWFAWLCIAIFLTALVTSRRKHASTSP
jgi:apolipoprotein N-acyltransferase